MDEEQSYTLLLGVYTGVNLKVTWKHIKLFYFSIFGISTIDKNGFKILTFDWHQVFFSRFALCPKV